MRVRCSPGTGNMTTSLEWEAVLMGSGMGGKNCSPGAVEKLFQEFQSISLRGAAKPEV